MRNPEDKGGASASLPLVSAVVPFRDDRGTLPRRLAALAASAYPRLEIILVDDGSSDGSSNVARAFASGGDRAGPGARMPCRLIRSAERLWTGGGQERGRPGGGGGMGIYLFGNRAFLGFARRLGGGRFAMGVAAMHFLYYLYASAGFAVGLAAHAVDRMRGSRSSPADTTVPGGGLESSRSG